MSETPTTRPTSDDGNPMLRMAVGLLLDVGLPIITYYVLHLLGATDWVALLAATLVALLRIVWGGVRHRRLNQFATVMLLVYGLSLALAFVSGDERVLLLKNSLVTASVATVFLVTAIRGKQPLTLSAMQGVMPGKADEFAHWYRTRPEARHGFRLTSTVWGIGLLAEAVVRIPIVYLLPISVGYGVSEALFIATMAGLFLWNMWYVRRYDLGVPAASSPADSA